MLKKILLALLVVFIGLLGFISMRPATFEVKRELQMAASPDMAFAQVTDFKNWATWSPWDHLDPNMKKTYTGPTSGAGAKYEWVGNKDVGQGSMEITEATPGKRVVIDLRFITPFEAQNVTTFDFAPTATGTTVTWSMAGKNNFMAKAAGLFMNMDSMIGSDFEKGLAGMKTAAEKAAADAMAAKKAADDAAAAAPAPEAAAAVDAGTP